MPTVNPTPLYQAITGHQERKKESTTLVEIAKLEEILPPLLEKSTNWFKALIMIRAAISDIYFWRWNRALTEALDNAQNKLPQADRRMEPEDLRMCTNGQVDEELERLTELKHQIEKHTRKIKLLATNLREAADDWWPSRFSKKLKVAKALFPDHEKYATL